MTDRDAGYREGIEAELLPCPFCGSRMVAQGATGKQTISVWCMGCGTRGPDVPFPDFCEPVGQIEQCHKKWNTRAPLPSTPDDGKAEPVAWQWRFRGSKWRSCSKDFFNYTLEIKAEGNTEFEVRPLYTHPSLASDCAIRPAALEALRSYEQADADGVMVLVSRQALDEAINALSAHAGDAAKESGGEPLCSRCQFWVNLHPTKGMGECCIGGLSKLRPIKSPNDSCDRFSLSCPPDTHAEVKG